MEGDFGEYFVVLVVLCHSWSVRVMEWDNVFIILIIAKDVPKLSPLETRCPQMMEKIRRTMVLGSILKYREVENKENERR